MLRLSPASLLPLCVACALLLPSAAAAHIGIPEGKRPFFTAGELAGGGTTWGIVLQEEGCWLRVCEEAIGGPPSFYYRQTDGSILFGNSSGLNRTDDGGCSHEDHASAFTDKNAAVLAVPRAQPATLYVGTGDPAGGNFIQKSTDEGETFSPTQLTDENVTFRSLVTSSDGQGVWAIGLDLGASPPAPVLYTSSDGGATFATSTPWPGNTQFATLLSYDETAGLPVVVLIGVTGIGSTMGTLSADGTSFSEVATFLPDAGPGVGVVSDFVGLPDTYVVILNRQELYTSPRSSVSFTAQMDGPTRCLYQPPGDDRVWGCGQPFQQGHFLVSEDGLFWAPVMRFLDVVERDCPAGTLGDERCVYGSDGGVLQTCEGEGEGEGEGEDLDGGVSAEPAPPPDGCPCSTRADGRPTPDVALAALLGVLLLARRRRG
jgi:MYXO-CTERM domain-containing protein